MKYIKISKAKRNLDKLVDEVNEKDTSITIVNDKDKNAVLISLEKWNGIEETFYLYSIKGLLKNINDIKNNEDFENATIYNEN